jgi:phosphopantetheine adenylyltransferase
VLLKSKTNQHVLEKLPLRTERVRAFLNFIKPSIVPDIVPITDVYGPTGWDPNIQALVVSKETLDGAAASELSWSRRRTVFLTNKKLQSTAQSIIYPS